MYTDTLTLSKMPHSQMSCSLALVLMAIVKRMCGIRSWEELNQLMNKSSNRLISQTANESVLYLIHRMNSGELPVHGNSKHLCNEVCPE